MLIIIEQVNFSVCVYVCIYVCVHVCVSKLLFLCVCLYYFLWRGGGGFVFVFVLFVCFLLFFGGGVGGEVLCVQFVFVVCVCVVFCGDVGVFWCIFTISFLVFQMVLRS
jgi:hypothetical protein